MIGHASVLVETSAGGLLIDPWLQGSVLNNSWDLLEPSFVPADLWDRVRWIWFSHEHPDHFHPGSILTIPEAVRQRVLVLFQDTYDRKVRDWLTKNGFRVHELKPGRFFTLEGDTRVFLETSGVHDSWLAVQDAGKTFIDLNDCAVAPHVLDHTAQRFPRIDALFTQFSYASWPGNPEDTASHRAAANRYLDKLSDQVRRLKPVTVIPGASFVRFSHVENDWMNAGRASVAEAAQRVEAAGSRPVVLAPGEIWDGTTSKDNRPSIAHYMSLLTSRDFKLHDHPSVTEATILESATGFATRLKAQNNIVMLQVLKIVLGFFKPITFFLTDRQVNIAVDPLKGAKVVSGGQQAHDVALHSSALNQLLTQAWGLDTLVVSGRFRIPEGGLPRLHNSFNMATLNSAGIYASFSSLMSPPVLRKLAQAAMTWYRWRREMRREGKLAGGRSGD